MKTIRWLAGQSAGAVSAALLTAAVVGNSIYETTERNRLADPACWNTCATTEATGPWTGAEANIAQIVVERDTAGYTVVVSDADTSTVEKKRLRAAGAECYFDCAVDGGQWTGDAGDVVQLVLEKDSRGYTSVVTGHKTSNFANAPDDMRCVAVVE